jgi:TonB-linked SusC/RagA family outer membrane protein
MLAAFSASTASAQQQGAVTGRITDASTGQPVPTVQVTIAGTTLGAQSNRDGTYTIRGIPAGTVTVRALSLGYAEQSQQVTIGAGQTASVNFELRPSAIVLDPIVTTVTGQQRRVEVGNSVAQVSAAEVVQKSAVTNVGDVLTSRAPGVMVTPGTQTGAGFRVRIRGTSSLSLTNNPIYVIDGVRVEGTTGSSALSVGGTTASRAGDINPLEIESIEIVRGPSAATLYGTDAANGVIVITTKRGVAGRPQWNYYTEQTAITDRNTYPDAYWGWRTGPTSATTSAPNNTVQCYLSQVAAGACVQDSVTRFNLHKDKETTPYGTGYRQLHGLQVKGGTDAVRYFLHGEWEDETGVMKVPEFEKRIIAARGLALRPEQEHPSHMGRATARANLDIAARDNLDISIKTGYTSQDLRLPRSDDSGTAGIAGNTYGGPGFKYNTNAAGDTLYGWREYTPRTVYQATTTQGINRLISSASANWRPQNWLAARANFGLDYINRNETQLCRFGDCTNADDKKGFKYDYRTNFYTYTVDGSATATRDLNADFKSQTTLGVQYFRNVFTRNGAVGTELPPGAVTVTAGAVKRADESTDESRTLGAFLEQRVSFRDRLYLTGALRSDRNSAFGADFKTVFYPKLSASWIISEESFFPAPSWLSQLRLRTAYGASGVQPGTTDAVQYYVATRALGESGEMPGVVFSTLGNSNLRPERSAELEFGIDGNFWEDRISVELTRYDKTSRDALIARTLPPSLGTSATTRFENLGEVRNWGWEALLNARLLQRDALSWDVTLNGSMNDNKLVSLGGVPPIIGSTIQQRQGYPLNGWWSRRLVSYGDKNDDKIIAYNADAAKSEIVVTDTAEFLGYSMPRREAALSSGFEFFSGRVRLSGMVDYKGGHKIYNNTERIRCASRNNCAGLIDRNSSEFEQARTAMVRDHPSKSVAGFIEDGDFIRLREVALTLTPSGEWANKIFRGRSINATFAARNLGILWTKYTGVDPEAFGTTGDAPSSFQAFAPPSFFSFRLNLGF